MVGNVSQIDSVQVHAQAHQKRHKDMRRTVRFAFWEGVPGSLALSIADNFIGPLAIALGGAPLQIGLLSALPQLLATQSQLLTHSVVGWLHSRRRVLLITMGFGAFPWLAMAAIPHLSVANPVFWLIPLAVLNLVLYQFSAPAMGSWLADVVPLHRRGTFLGSRAALGNLVGTSLVLALGFLLDELGQWVMWGFTGIFAFAALMRLGSFAMAFNMHEPHLRPSGVQMGLWHFIKTAERTNLGRMVLYVAALYFGVFLAGPYFSIFMLRDLQFSYTTFVFLHTVHVAATIVGSRLWGLYADKHGNVNVVRITGLGISIMPFFWLVSHQVPFLMLVNTFGGLCWSGFTLCSLNYVYEATLPGERSRMVGYLAALGGVGLFLGALLGGLLAGYLPAPFAYPIMSLFLLSGIVRLVGGAAILPFLKESRGKG
ncbi:MAG: MFS transporter [Chloroflexi bacterium]|nr:MFS transporter [Chloroflexota bacterium]